MICDNPDNSLPATAYSPRARTRHIPVRMCCICRARRPKHRLYRYVCQRDDQGRATLTIDPQQIQPGRGFYVCSDTGCQRALARHKGWQKKCRGES